jgi:hypothetical protein
MPTESSRYFGPDFIAETYRVAYEQVSPMSGAHLGQPFHSWGIDRDAMTAYASSEELDLLKFAFLRNVRVPLVIDEASDRTVIIYEESDGTLHFARIHRDPLLAPFMLMLQAEYPLSDGYVISELRCRVGWNVFVHRAGVAEYMIPVDTTVRTALSEGESVNWLAIPMDRAADILKKRIRDSNARLKAIQQNATQSN